MEKFTTGEGADALQSELERLRGELAEQETLRRKAEDEARQARQELERLRDGEKGAAPETRANSIGMTFVLVPAGSFLMGSPGDLGNDDEHPQHPVSITRPFFLGNCPVTQAQWQAVMGKNPSWLKRPDHPVEQVSWLDAREFIERLNSLEGHNRYRLPSEAEWEYACRAGTTTVWPFGDEALLLGRHAWFYQSSIFTFRHSHHPVGQKEANPWGLFDMCGNVREWVRDWYDKEAYREGPPRDPGGPETGRERVQRGGGWTDYAGNCRSAVRYRARPDKRDKAVGFRLVLDVE